MISKKDLSIKVKITSHSAAASWVTYHISQDLLRVTQRLELQRNFDEVFLPHNVQMCLKDGEKNELSFALVANNDVTSRLQGL